MSHIKIFYRESITNIIRNIVRLHQHQEYRPLTNSRMAGSDLLGYQRSHIRCSGNRLSESTAAF